MNTLGSPYIPEPKWAKYIEKVLFLVTYAHLFILGLVAATENTPSVVLMKPVMPTDYGLETIGLLIMLSSLAAFIGVAVGHYRIEWVALNPLTAAVVIVGIVALGSQLHILAICAFLVAALIGTRLLRLGLLARKLRNKWRLLGKSKEC